MHSKHKGCNNVFRIENRRRNRDVNFTYSATKLLQQQIQLGLCVKTDKRKCLFFILGICGEGRQDTHAGEYVQGGEQLYIVKQDPKHSKYRASLLCKETDHYNKGYLSF